jgi:hypothetical protein
MPRSAPFALSIAAITGGCRAPTEITLVVSTDVPCADARGLGIAVGDLGDLESSARTSTTTPTCDASGALGTMVLVPSGAKNERVAFRITLGDAKSCAPNAPCIVARRSLRYLPHTPLRVLVPLRRQCAGVPCKTDETCVSGACVPADIIDVEACAGPAGCGEAALNGAQTPPDAGRDVASGPATYNDASDPRNWSSLDVSALDNRAKGFMGAAFDGRYMYFVPHYNTTIAASGVLARYDTAAAFDASSSWSFLDTATLVSPSARGFAGAAFDGRYVYLVPNKFAGAPSGVVTRYDTTVPFGSAGSWSTFDIASLAATATGFLGAAFDGRYVYFANSEGNPISYQARYDTRGPFSSPGSWSIFDAAPLFGGSPPTFFGAVFDGRYVYFVRGYSGAATNGGVARYDPQGPFTSATSWTTFDVSSVDANAVGFRGAAFDGRYVYLVPYASGALKSLAARYDTLAPFATATSWSLFDTKTASPNASGFWGATFDGRYIYLAPSATATLARFDTTASFAARDSWTTHDPGVLDPEFVGAAFDGRYVFFVPGNPTGSGVVVRFDARSPRAMPNVPGYYGSFL